MTKTTYTDKEGNKKEGYIQNGTAYTDSSLTTKVPTGSVVETAGGTYYKGEERPYGVEVVKPSANDDSFKLSDNQSYKTHYNQKGEAFVDEGLTTRVPTGSSMVKDGSSYKNDERYGVTPTVSGARNDYTNDVRGLNDYMLAANEAQQRAIAARTKSRLNVIRNREKEVLREKVDADRLSYNTYLQAINPYGANAQKMAKLGLSNSGFSESSMVNLGAMYQQALAGNERARAEAMLELKRLTDEAIAEGDRQKYDTYANLYTLMYNGGLQAASKNADLGMQAAGAMDNKETRYEENARADTIRAEENAREDEQRAEDMEFNREMAKASTEKEAAEVIVKYVMSGLYTLDQIARILGVSKSELNEIIKRYF